MGWAREIGSENHLLKLINKLHVSRTDFFSTSVVSHQFVSTTVTRTEVNTDNTVDHRSVG